MASSRSPSPSPCLWLLLAAFDLERQGLPFTRTHVWPYLSDLDGLRACCVNRTTLRHYDSFPLRRRFVLFAFPASPRDAPLGHDLGTALNNAVCFPAVTQLNYYHAGRWELAAVLPRL